MKIIQKLATIQSRYIFILHSYPLVSKATTSGVLYFLSDSIVQGIEMKKDKDKKYDYMRSIRMTVFGFCVTGPLFHYWYQLLDKNFPKKSTKHVLIKCVIDQAVCSPIFNALFFSGMGFLEGKNTEQIKEKLKNDWLTTYISDCLVWPILNFVNFKYIQSVQRVTFMNICNIGWGAFLAKMNSSH
ncbi:hypothetical protein RB653_009458 [Dictyostelium firmibasis]|uniref:Uncharacterized protein n=1 Tax=Dictyostelium firmibasis TaxID=79012 RepID=A0AAN7YXD8_9MYCE